MTDVFPENIQLMQAPSQRAYTVVHLIVHLAVRHTILLASLYGDALIFNLHLADSNVAI